MNPNSFSVLSTLDLEQRQFLSKKLNFNWKSKYHSVLEAYLKNKEYRDQIAQTIRNNCHQLIEPYLNIKTIIYHPNQIEKIAIQVARETYHLVSSRNQSIESFKYLEKDSSKYLALYQSKTLWSDRLIIGFRGTKELEDLLPDYYIARNKHTISDRFQKTLEKFDQIRLKYPKSRIYLTGHSLGGSLAIWINQNRSEEIIKCYAFNPGYNAYMMPKLNLKNDQVKIMIVKGDPISNTILALKEELKPFSKNLIILAGKNNSPLQNHQLTNFTQLQ